MIGAAVSATRQGRPVRLGRCRLWRGRRIRLALLRHLAEALAYRGAPDRIAAAA
jgi:hypothetical protein